MRLGSNTPTLRYGNSPFGYAKTSLEDWVVKELIDKLLLKISARWMGASV
jgi:hypothetical protein